jgi:hypothetical protein
MPTHVWGAFAGQILRGVTACSVVFVAFLEGFAIDICVAQNIA